MIKGIYPSSEQGNFSIIDTILVPHPYCITPKHLKYSNTMILDIEGAEKKGAQCDICRKNVKKGVQNKVLSFNEHREGLLVSCKLEINPTPDELKKYLLSIKEEAEKNGYVGFAFTKE